MIDLDDGALNQITIIEVPLMVESTALMKSPFGADVVDGNLGDL